MKNIFFVALNTVKEIKRHKILYALGTVIIFIIVSGLILGPLSLSEQKRLSINFAFTACHIGLIIVSVYFASTLISHEIEKKTVVTLFVRPISRLQFIIGKFFGLSCVLLAALCFLTLFVLVLHFVYKHSVTPVLFIAMWGIFLEALILLTVAFFFSSFTSSFLVLVYSVFIFIIGHSASGIFFFLNRGQEDHFLRLILAVVVRALPDFEQLNWRAHALYHDSLVKGELLFSSLYAFSWIVVLLTVTGILFERKQVV